MSPIAVGVVAGLAFLQASIAAPRDKFADCLQSAGAQAAAQKVAPDQYSAFASQQCAAQASAFKAALIAFDSKNGIKRAKAASDAQLQVDDYVAMSAEKYEAKAPKIKSAAPPVQPVQAAAAVEPKGN